MKTRQHAKTCQMPLAGFSSNPDADLAQNPPTCHGNQGPSLSAQAPREGKELERLSPESKRELLGFRERLTDVAASTRHAYVFGARDLLLFIEGRGVSLDQVSLPDWRAFEEQLRGCRERGEIGPSWAPGVLSGARRFLRERAEHGGPLDVALVPHVTPKNWNARCGLMAAACDKKGSQVVGEVEAFSRSRAALGYPETSNARQGAFRLLSFLAARGLELRDMTASDWDDFRREATNGTRFKDAAALLVGASAYLRMKVEEGVLARSPVPARPRKRAQAPVLPDDLRASLRALEEGMAAQDLASTTRTSYRRAVWGLLAWASEEHGALRLSDVTRDLLTAYRMRLQTEPSAKGTPYALHTQIGTLAALRFFFTWLVRTGRLLLDPTLHLPHPRPPQYLPRSLEVTEITRLIRSLPKNTLGRRDRAMVELLYGTGMRRSEIAKLDLTDVDFEERRILIRLGKGGKDRVVPLGRKAKEALLDYVEHVRPRLLRGSDCGAVFLGRAGRRLGKNHVTTRVHDLGQRIHLKLAPHLLRHSCATHLLKGRADIRHIQRLLGHESLQTTERYTKVELQDLRGVIDRCHPREKENEKGNDKA